MRSIPGTQSWFSTGTSGFSEVHFTPLCFYKRPTLVPVLANQKKFEEGFHFYRKRQKAKIVFSVGFAASFWRDNTQSKQQEWHSQAPSPGTTLSISSSYHSFELCLWASILFLFCSSISKMHPKVIASSLYTISAYEVFHRKGIHSDSGGNL